MEAPFAAPTVPTIQKGELLAEEQKILSQECCQEQASKFSQLKEDTEEQKAAKAVAKKAKEEAELQANALILHFAFWTAMTWLCIEIGDA